MKHNVTFSTDGRVVRPQLVGGMGLGNLPYTPHPLQLLGHVPMPVLGSAPAAGRGASNRLLQFMNRLTLR